MTSNKSLCVFCGAQNKVPKEHLDLGATFGSEMAKRGYSLVYGGGDCGLMGEVANSVLKGKGHVTGVFPISLRNLENEHQSLSEIIIVGGMHERKHIMYERSHAFIVLPGGFGTMDEMFEIITWRQLQLHNKPIIIVNYNDYWGHLVALMEKIIDTGFARLETRDFYRVVNTVEEAFEALKGYGI